MTWRSVLRAVVRWVFVGTKGTESGTEASEFDDDPSFREIEVVNWPATRNDCTRHLLVTQILLVE